MPTQCCMESWRKIFIAFSKCRMPSGESFSVLRRPNSATLPICCVICTGYLFSTVYSINSHYWLSTLATTTHHCICHVYFITMYLVTVYVPVSLTCYLCRRINLILAHVVSALPRLLYGAHFLLTFVHVHSCMYIGTCTYRWRQYCGHFVVMYAYSMLSGCVGLVCTLAQ